MKKILAILMALAMIFSFAACGEKDDDDKDNKTKSSADAKAEKEDIFEATEEYYAAVLSCKGQKIKNAMPSVLEKYFESEDLFADMTEEEKAMIETLYGIDFSSVTAAYEFYAIGVLSEIGDVDDISVEDVDYKKMSEKEIKEKIDEIKSEGIEDFVFDDGAKGEAELLITFSDGSQDTIKQKLLFIKENDIWKVSADEEDETEVTTLNPENPDVVPVTPPAEDDKLSKGVISGDIYTNAFADITFNKPYDWTFSSDQELKESLNAGFDLMNVTDLEAALAEQACIYDMMSESADSTSNALVMFALGEAGLDEVTYAEMLKEELESYADEGIYYEMGEVTVKNFAGKIYHVLPLILNDSVYQNMYIRIIDEVVVVVTLTTTSEADFAQLEAMFS